MSIVITHCSKNIQWESNHGVRCYEQLSAKIFKCCLQWINAKCFITRNSQPISLMLVSIHVFFIIGNCLKQLFALGFATRESDFTAMRRSSRSIMGLLGTLLYFKPLSFFCPMLQVLLSMNSCNTQRKQCSRAGLGEKRMS